MRSWRWIAALGVILAVSVVACAGPGLASREGTNVGKPARDITLEALHGGQSSLSDYRGSVVLINFWATWCPPCKAEIPALEAAYQAHRDEGFVVLGINVQESRQQVEPFVADMGVTYPVLLDENGRVMKEYRVLGLPMSLIVDRDRVIQVWHVGYLSGGKLDDYLAQVLP